MGVSVYRKKRSPYWWMRVEKTPFKVEKSTKLKDKGKAEELANHVYDQLEIRWLNMMKGTPDCKDDPNMTISQALQFVMEKRWANNTSGDRQYDHVKRCIKILGDIPIRSINADVTNKLRSALEKWPIGVDDDGNVRYLHPTTVDRYMRSMCTVMRTLKKRSSAFHDLNIPHFEIKQIPNARERILTGEEEMALFSLMKVRHPDYHDLCVVLLDTGMRLSEALNMDYEYNINKECNLIRLRGTQTKNKKPRTLPVSKRSQEILLRRKKDSPWQPFHSSVIPSRSAVAQKFRWYRTVLGIDDKEFVPHMLRHTCCTRLLEAGIPFDRVQAWMGHSTAEMTRRYGHLTSASLEGAAEAINERNKANADAHAAQLRAKFSVVNG